MDKKYWLVILTAVILGILLYSSINLGMYVTGSAIISHPFHINAWDIKAREVVIGLKNNEQEDYKIQSVSVEGCSSYSTPTDIEAGTKVTFIINCQQTLKKGDKFKGEVVITYRKINGSVDLTSTGTIEGKVRE